MTLIESAGVSDIASPDHGARRSARPSPRGPARTALLAFTLLALAACGPSQCNTTGSRRASPCLPDGVPAAARPAEAAAAPASIRVFLDGSQSMGGYLEPSLGLQRPLADLLRLVGGREGPGTTLQYFAFGEHIREIRDRARVGLYATPAAYNCRGAGCDNQQSLIDAVLNRVAEPGGGRLDVVITDLWLDNRSFSGSPQVALGGPLQRILRQGRAVGVIGVRAPFSGPVFTFPRTPPYHGARERPLFVLLIGDAGQVRAMADHLLQSRSPALEDSRTEFALFSSARPDPWVKPTLRVMGGGGVRREEVLGPNVLPGIPKYRIALAAAAQRKGRIEGTFDSAEGLPADLVWQGPMLGQTRAWKLEKPDELAGCPAGTWRKFPSPTGVWTQAGGTRANFAITSKVGTSLLPPGIYYVLAELGTSALETERNPATDWMRAWSVSAADAPAFQARKPAIFKALELASFAGLMEEELARQAGARINRRFGFILKVER